MFDLDKWLEIYQTLVKNPLRTLLTALGVFWGIFMLLVMLGSGKGLENGVMRDFDGIAPNSLFMWSQQTSKPYKGFLAGRGIEMTLDDFEALKMGIPEAKVITPRNQLGGFQGNNNVSHDEKNGAFNIMGDFPEILVVEPVTITGGRFINDKDMIDRRKVAVIGQRVQELLFEEEDPIGEYIQINNVYFLVVGTFKSKQTGERGQRDTERIYVPFTTFMQAFNYGNRVGWFTMNAKEGYPSSLVGEKAIKILKSRHKVHPDDNRAFGHFNLEEQFNQIQGLFIGIQSISWFVGLMTLLAGIVGVSNIMLVIVKERTKEIGIRRAIGARPANIVSQIVLESITLTAVAGYVGLLLGVGLMELVGQFVNGQEDMIFYNPEVNFRTAIFAVVVLVITGALAGMIPARKAIKVSPVDALRAE